jgi:signal transduction histidine kinase
MSERHQRPWQAWAGAATIAAVAVIASVVVVLTAHHVSKIDAGRDARGAVANAVGPVSDAVSTAMTTATADPTTGKQVAYADAAASGVPEAVAVEARDSGKAVLADSGSGLVVTATYDTATVPASVQERRDHVSGLRIVPLDLSRELDRLRPARGGISLAGPDHRVISLPGARPAGRSAYDVALAPEPAPQWTLTIWEPRPTIPGGAWLAAFALVLLGMGSSALFIRRDDRSRRSRQEVERLQESSATTAALATVAQHSLDLADLLPALTTELVDALGLQGLSLSTPKAHGDRLSFVWGQTPAEVPVAARLPEGLATGETLCLNLARGGRTVARLRVVAGRDLDRHDVEALGAAAEVLTSALTNAEAFTQQGELLERMKAVDELKTVFLATASHELRTPVGAISGYAQLLAGAWDSMSPEDGRLYAERVDSNARRLGALVDDLLDFSRLERGAGVTTDGVVVDLGDTVSRVLDERPGLATDHRLETDVATGVCVVGSEQAVERVVSNLVGNAEKYSPSGTLIRVSVSEHQGRALLVIDDEGPGVPATERDQIFSRFFRGGGDAVVSTRGVGLGLAIVHEFAASMGGEVSVEASDSGGARFVVSYPLAAPTGTTFEGAADVSA